MTTLDNPDPLLSLNRPELNDDDGDDCATSALAEEIFEYLKDIKDPEHPYTLQQLKVLKERYIVAEDLGTEYNIAVEFTPTVPHCSLASMIGLCIVEKLRRELQKPFKITIKVTPGSHSTEHEINKQVNDKERVAAALENPHIMTLVNEYVTYQPYE